MPCLSPSQILSIAKEISFLLTLLDGLLGIRPSATA